MKSDERQLRIARQVARESIAEEKTAADDYKNISKGLNDLSRSFKNPSSPNFNKSVSKGFNNLGKSFGKLPKADDESTEEAKMVTAGTSAKLLSGAEDNLILLYMTAYDDDLTPADLIDYAKDFLAETDKASKRLLDFIDWDMRENKVKNYKNIIMLKCELSGEFTKDEANKALLDAGL